MATEEYVLDVIVERKTINDLYGSILDKRYINLFNIIHIPYNCKINFI